MHASHEGWILYTHQVKNFVKKIETTKVEFQELEKMDLSRAFSTVPLPYVASSE
jgi:hypothetical protein